ncbi:MAG: hypothetical protein V1886_01050 [archaeon]
MMDLDLLSDKELEEMLPKGLDILKFEEIKPNNFYLMKQKRFESFSGPRKEYNEIIDFFNKNPKEHRDSYDFAEFNMEYANKEIK